MGGIDKGSECSMSDVLIVAILSLAGTIFGTLIGSWQTRNLMEYRLGILEKKMDEHNRIQARVLVLEKDVEVAFAQIGENKRDIRDLGE